MKNILLIPMLGLLLVLGSCKKDFLNPKQIDLVYNDVYWNNDKDAEKAVLGIYSLYRGVILNAQMYERGDCTTSFFRGGWLGGSPHQLYQTGNFINGSTEKSWGSLESYAEWNSFYKVIAQANLTISKITQMDDKLFAPGGKAKLLGETYFLRALTYYNIATIWGNAPLLLEPVESSTQVIDGDGNLITIGRSTDIQIMDAVLSDVANAVKNLSYGVQGSDAWGVRANKGSAQTLAGYADLWMAFLKQRDGQANTTYIQNAVNSLDSVVRFGNYNLAGYAAAADIANMYKGRSCEAVFELSVSANLNESYRIDKNKSIQNITCKVVPLDGDPTKDRTSYINWVPYSSKKAVYSEYPADKRADLFFAVWQSTYDEPYADVSATATNRNLVTWITKYAAMVPDPAAQWNEYTAYFADCNMPVFRYTDVKLLLAEAYIKNGKAAMAVPIINEIRTRAGLSPYAGTNYMTEVLQQRTCELIGEGKLFFDYIRNNYLANIPAMDMNRYQQKGYYWPVSSSILTSNKKIQQTPYWNGKTQW